MKIFLFLIFIIIPQIFTHPFGVPYRRPNSYEIDNDISLVVSDKNIENTQTEERVLNFLVKKNYFSNNFLEKWMTLKSLRVLTPFQANTMVNIKIAEENAIKTFQKDNNLPVTGIIDQSLIELMISPFCGTINFVDENNDGDETKKNN